MSRINYSKWDHIEISDDEDDTHPNIDTPSLFRWRHQARIERDAAFKQEKNEFQDEYQEFIKKFHECQRDLGIAKETNSPNVAKLQEEFKKLEVVEAEWKVKESDMQKKERLKPLSIDTICKDSSSRTLINVSKPVASTEDLDGDDAVNNLMDFVKKHDKEIKKFGLFQKPASSEVYLLENLFLVCEETANQLVLWCIDLAMEEKFDLMNHVSHQCIVMQFMLELAKSLKRDPRSCVQPFFAKFKNPEPEYRKAFDEELSAFRQRIRARAKVRLEEAIQKLEEEEREKRLGPGGLDPLEVLETLPPDLKECFQNQNVENLKTVLCNMRPQDVEYHMKRCVDSGLWVENATETELATDEIGDETEVTNTKEIETSVSPMATPVSEGSASTDTVV